MHGENEDDAGITANATGERGESALIARHIVQDSSTTPQPPLTLIMLIAARYIADDYASESKAREQEADERETDQC